MIFLFELNVVLLRDDNELNNVIEALLEKGYKID